MNVWWHPYPLPPEGIARGYLASAFYLCEALTSMGVGIGEGESGDALIHFGPPHFFTPVKGRTNVLFSMWETPNLPNDMLEPLQRADYLVVPSDFCRKVWMNHGLKARVVPLGLPEAFAEVDSSRSPLAGPGGGGRLRFLWVGSATPRKGWFLITPAWRQAFENTNMNVQLYIKTIGDGQVREAYGNKLVTDTRDLDSAALLELYMSAHVFVFPSIGEGFGLPALEAMATGCLLIAPSRTGLKDFVDHSVALVLDTQKAVEVEYGVRQRIMMPTVGELSHHMRLVYDRWGSRELETMRELGATRAKRFTWRASASALLQMVAATVSRTRSITSQPQKEI